MVVMWWWCHHQGWNDLRKGCDSILRHLHKNDSGLHTVGLQWSGMRNEDGGAVEYALHHAQQIKVLDISNNEIGEKAAMVCHNSAPAEPVTVGCAGGS